jgi:hypothetical protein
VNRKNAYSPRLSPARKALVPKCLCRTGESGEYKPLFLYGEKQYPIPLCVVCMLYQWLTRSFSGVTFTSLHNTLINIKLYRVNMVRRDIHRRGYYNVLVMYISSLFLSRYSHTILFYMILQSLYASLIKFIISSCLSRSRYRRVLSRFSPPFITCCYEKF